MEVETTVEDNNQHKDEDKNLMREEFVQWLTLPETKIYRARIQEEMDAIFDAMLNLTSFGEEMMKDYYQLKGSATGLAAALSIMQDLAII